MSDERREPERAAGNTNAKPKMCKCGRGPWRKGQRNCIYCNREANAKYRESLRIEITRNIFRQPVGRP